VPRSFNVAVLLNPAAVTNMICPFGTSRRGRARPQR
jgi:hypothetical protein